jgi:hypothetical protein
MGSADPAAHKLTNPQSGLAFTLEGADSHHLAIAPAPAFGGAEQAADAVELYWQALARDVPFSDYAAKPSPSECNSSSNSCCRCCRAATT